MQIAGVGAPRVECAHHDVDTGPATGRSREIFTELMAALGPGVRCVAIDLPDMGESGAWASRSPGEIAVALQTFLPAAGASSARSWSGIHTVA